jgi:4'-phosphopantetheinyl transferase EntD
MHHLTTELMPVDITEALSGRFRSEFGQKPSRCASRGRTEQPVTSELKSAVEWTVIRAMAAADSSLGLGQNVGLAMVSGEDQASYALHAEEARILSPRACGRKRVEFALGRTAAHFALGQIGFGNPAPVLRGQKGEPIWPDGIVGSITHCHPWSVAVAVQCSNGFAIGVDLETKERMHGTDISDLVCREVELDWVRGGDFQQRLTMIFSAKEAVYKALYPLCRRYIDFKEVELTWFPEQHRFQGRFLTPLGPNVQQGQACAVHCRCHAELVFSCLVHQFK